MRPSQKASGLSLSASLRRTSEELSPRSVAWRPGSKVKDDSSDDEVRHKKPPKSPSGRRSRFSNEVIGLRDVSSEDSETTSRRSFQKLKKKKKRHMRNLSDSDDI